MQTAIVIIILALAAMYVIWRFWRARQGASCCSGCGGSCGCSDSKPRLEPLRSVNPSNSGGQPKGSCTSCGCGSREPADNQNS
ncbi:FeoB-associated Cys-rich membrane protein [Desulfocurvibacter africanus]|uniref:FeoB-associated Cys-rich membrane protein n=1 Tax=Desulfocurvibacter africanus TaxID=873 RepID=UPI0009DBB816